jgi:hypothetical protein
MNPLIPSSFEIVFPAAQGQFSNKNPGVSGVSMASEQVPEAKPEAQPTFTFTEKDDFFKETSPFIKLMEQWHGFFKISEEDQKAWQDRRNDYAQRLFSCMNSMKGSDATHMDLSENPTFNDLIGEGVREGFLNMTTMIDSGAQNVPPGEVIISYNTHYTPPSLT